MHLTFNSDRNKSTGMSCRKQTKIPSKALLLWRDGRISRLPISRILNERIAIAVGNEVQAWRANPSDIHDCQILHLHGKHISFRFDHLSLENFQPPFCASHYSLVFFFFKLLDILYF